MVTKHAKNKVVKEVVVNPNEATSIPIDVPKEPTPETPQQEQARLRLEAEKQNAEMIERQRKEKMWIRPQLDYLRTKVEFNKLKYEAFLYEEQRKSLSGEMAQRDVMITDTIVNVMKTKFLLVVSEDDKKDIVKRVIEVLSKHQPQQ